MTAEEIVQILQACQATGVSAFKNGVIDVTFKSEIVPRDTKISNVSQHLPQALVSSPVGISLEEEVEIKHKVEELSSIMKLGDNELIDRMFPLPNEEAETA